MVTVLAFSSIALAGSPQPPQDPAAREALLAATAADHRDMLRQLGIEDLRPGPSGNESAPNHANFDEALANPYPNLPDPLTLRNGKKVASASDWTRRRRPEIVEMFEREVTGRVPRVVPKVTWSETRTEEWMAGPHAAVGRALVGHVDNASFPAVSVDIQMTLVTPKAATGPVPVMIMFGNGLLPSAAAALPARTPPPGAMGNDPPATEQLIAAGWGYASLSPASIQADNGAGLTKGVIGLVNKGERRKPEDWGALRAWAWGASRALDYFETQHIVDARRVGIEGVSRYGKAALVTMAFDQRFAIVLVGSSGEGGAKLHRRNFGEAVENLTGSGEYHWMAGNFLKYGAEKATFGRKTVGDLPVDAHELIALCAPRPTFISYGIPEKGDARWLDQEGSFMATIAAQPVFRLLGARTLGRSDDYKTEKMPPVNEGLLDGQLAWRQHDGGHTDAPNWKYFIPWADRMLKRDTAMSGAQQAAVIVGPADVARPREDPVSQLAHQELLKKARSGRIDVYFAGDSIARRWGATDYPELLANWRANFFGWNVGDFGWGADRTEHILWRLQHGELDDVRPKVIVLLAGANNVGHDEPAEGPDAKAADVARGIKAILDVMRAKAPEATIVLTAMFPRNDNMAVMPTIDRINTIIAGFADGKTIRFLDINAQLANARGELIDGVMNSDKLHPTVKGYQIWADALKPILTELLGPPAAEDHAPAPTGVPAVSPKAWD
jgi:lysophospholipase L1-like esterase